MAWEREWRRVWNKPKTSTYVWIHGSLNKQKSKKPWQEKVNGVSKMWLTYKFRKKLTKTYYFSLRNVCSSEAAVHGVLK